MKTVEDFSQGQTVEADILHADGAKRPRRGVVIGGTPRSVWVAFPRDDGSPLELAMPPNDLREVSQ
jgi:hypothetical protein